MQDMESDMERDLSFKIRKDLSCFGKSFPVRGAGGSAAEQVLACTRLREVAQTLYSQVFFSARV